jgi:hypothetical protein
MTIGICFVGEQRRDTQDQWSFLLSNFGDPECWEIEKASVEAVYQKPVKIKTAEELPSDRPLVVLAPEAGKYVQGTENLKDFEHPDDAIYLFGSSHLNLCEDEMGDRVADHCVYIPLVKCECYAPPAAYMTLWDRYVKRGSHG